MTPFTPVTRCRSCLGERLTSVLDLGHMPLANAFHTGTEGPRYPLELMVCEDCWHGQLSGVVAGEEMFTDYPYRSSVSRTFREHCRGLTTVARGLVSVERPRVLDIGCNDGFLLSLFREAGCEVLGVDPALNMKGRWIDAPVDRVDVPVENAFWSVKFASWLLPRKFDIITAQNVFAHAPDPADFLAGCALVLADGGAVLIEVPHALELFAGNEFDTIYHEHLSYFTVSSFARLVERTPLAIADITRLPVHGGSLRFVLRRRSDDYYTVAVGALKAVERAQRMCDPAAYRNFRFKVQVIRRDFLRLVEDCRKRGEKVIGYGAAAKGTVALNYFGVDLDYVVDDTPLKWNKRIPGRSTPVVPPELLKMEPKPLNIVVLAWNWLDEIRQRVRSLRGNRDRLITYVPEVRCLEPEKA